MTIIAAHELPPLHYSEETRRTHAVYPIPTVQDPTFLPEDCNVKEYILTRNVTETNEGTATPIPEEFELLHMYWQASNYLSVGQVSISIINHQTPLTDNEMIASTNVHFPTLE
jgi:hypothetical protein